MTIESTQLMPARKSGENPSTTAPFSFSAAARVARPKRVYWNTSHSNTDSAITTIATKSWSAAIVVTPRWTWVVFFTPGNGGTCCEVMLNRKMIVACKNTNTPTVATTLASGGACRSGRKIRKWNASPRSTQKPSEMNSAGQMPIPLLDPSESDTGRSGILVPKIPWIGFNGFGNGGRKSFPVLRKTVYTYATYIATAPFERFTTPEPR